LELTDCSQPKSCRALKEPRSSPSPTRHLHPGLDQTIGLYQWSETLLAISELPLFSVLSGLGDNFILASDSSLPSWKPGRGRGAFAASSFPVVIPSAHCLTEAFVRKALADRSNPYMIYWMAMLTYIMEYVDRDGLLNDALLEPCCRTFYCGLRDTNDSLGDLLDKLEDSINAK
jgi:hypothetical protein